MAFRGWKDGHGSLLPASAAKTQRTGMHDEELLILSPSLPVPRPVLASLRSRISLFKGESADSVRPQGPHCAALPACHPGKPDRPSWPPLPKAAPHSTTASCSSRGSCPCLTDQVLQLPLQLCILFLFLLAV